MKKTIILFSLFCIAFSSIAQPFEVFSNNGAVTIVNNDTLDLPFQTGYSYEFVGECWAYQTGRLPVQQQYQLNVGNDDFLVRRILWVKFGPNWQQQSSTCYVSNYTSSVDTVELQPIVVNVPQSTYYVTWYDVSMHNDNIVFDGIQNKCPNEVEEHLLVVYSSTGYQLNYPYPSGQLFFTRIMEWDGHYYVQTGSVFNN